MQRLLKFANSPNINRKQGNAEQTGAGRCLRSVESMGDRDELDGKLKTLSLSPPLPDQDDPSAPASSTSAATPSRNRRMAFFNSNRYSLDEYSAGAGTGAGPNQRRGNGSPPSTSPTASPQNSHRRAAVHLAASPIRLLGPKTSAGLGATTGAPSLTDFGDLEYLNSSNEGYRLTVEQRELVRQAWRNSNDERERGAPGVWIFKRIFAHYPHLKRVFNLHEVEDERELDCDPQFQKHAQVFTDVLEMIVECIDALDDCLGPLLLSYGSKHVNFESGNGFKPEYWDAFAVAMIEYATNNWKLMKHTNRRAEALRAWRILVFFVVSKVKQGFVLEKKAREKTRMNSCENEA